MTYPLRESVRVVLLNDSNQLLLMCMDDPGIRSVGEEYKGRFWMPIGGQREGNESVLETATREVFEETGIVSGDIDFGPVVWTEELDLVMPGGPMHIRQQYIAARTKQKSITLANLAGDEPQVVKGLAWFSLQEILESRETIYPVALRAHLPAIVAGAHPNEPLDISEHAPY